jgi:hypothetical protein
MSALPRVVLLLGSVLGFLGQGPPGSNPPPAAKIWVGRHQEIEDYLRTAECVKLEFFGGYRAGRCTLRPGGPVARMAWRPLPPGVHGGFRESYKAEIAAYELDKLLEMEMVPPTVERQLAGARGGAQVWVENIVDLTTDESPPTLHRTAWEMQVARMTMFDNFIGNAGRNRGNTLRDGAWNLILIDHSRAFGVEAELYHKMNRIDVAYWDRLERLTRKQLETVLGPWLDGNAIDAFLLRRDKMRIEIKTLQR